MRGRLIVIEGTDGSGKSTQFGQLCQRLDAMGQEYKKLVFPQYQEPSSALIRMYLGGEFGSHPGDVNPYAASAFYAVDRYASLKKVELLRGRESATHTKADIHELDTEYLATCRACAHQAIGELGWKRISCLDREGQLRSIQEIHQEIWSLVTPLL